mmetsp:Transcript_813/g.1404  ORF Transcript_813/g.1404 Transcript_813/m.1404 type:complete len:920 (+) Transcript_813:138-2897(+)
MDPERIHAYLQAACAGLGFDVGEVWFSSSETGSSTVAKIESKAIHSSADEQVGGSISRQRDIKFLQLYTSKSYKNRRKDLLRPASEDPEIQLTDKSQNSAEEIKKHVLSPKLVDAIANTAQVVWANCQEREGLLGRSDMRLQTAVGMPVAMDADGNMCIVVMFSPNNVQSSKDAVEYLKSLSEGATSTSIPCLLPVFDSGAKKLEYNPKRFIEWEEHEKQFKQESNLIENGDVDNVSNDNDLSLDDFSSDFYGIPLLPPFAELESGDKQKVDGSSITDSEDVAAAANAFDQATFGLWSTIMENPVMTSTIEHIPEDATSAAAAISSQMDGALYIYPERKERLEEFSSAFLAMSVFDAADFWMPTMCSDGSTNLHHVFSLTSNENNTSINFFKLCSNNAVIKGWSGAVGRAFSTGSPVWSTNPDIIVDSVRREAFAISNIKTALAVPIFSAGSIAPSCVLSFYSLVRSDCVPFVLKFVQQALRSLWLGLERLEPHQSIGRELWKEVAPADLGEMAADLEMQKAFYQKKRPFDAISSIQDTQHTNAVQTDIRDRSSSLAYQMQSLPSPSEDFSVAVNGGHSFSRKSYVVGRSYDFANQTTQALQNHIQEAIKLAANAQPVENSGEELNFMKKPYVDDSYIQDAVPYMHHGPLQTITTQQQSPAVNEFYPSSAVNDYVFCQVAGAQSYPPITMQHEQVTPHFTLVNGSASSSGGIITLPSLTDSQPQYYENLRLLNCRIEGCNEIAVPRRPYCSKHSGNRLCEFEGCAKCAQGATRFCISHGGGRRCTYPNCDKGARDKFFCAAHGGGKRCSVSGCNKSAVGGSNLCTSHGGGRRCLVEGCNKSAQSSTSFCVKHGGGKKCAHPGCEKVARGRTQFCASHGGGVRCKLEGCSRIAIGKLQLCRAHGGGAKDKFATNIMPSTL